MRVWVLLAGAGASSFLRAEAGPWGPEPGGSYVRAVQLAQRVQGLEAYRTELYAEHGVSSSWTATVKGEAAVFPNAAEFNQTGYRATLKRSFDQGGGLRFAVEGGVVGGEAIGGLNAGCVEAGGEARFSTGLSGVNRRRDWFLYADIVGRFHSGGCQRRRLEIGAGRAISDNWFATSQFFLQRGSDEGRTDKWEGALARRMGELEFAFGVRREFSGIFDETGVFLAASRRF